MTTHTFLVEVKVDGWDTDDGRDPAGYAFAALNTAGLSDARQLDGYADLSAEADITGIMPMD